MAKYKNLARVEADEEELEKLELEYRKANGEQVEQNEQPVAIEEESEEEKTWKKRYSDLRSFSDRKVNEEKAEKEALKARLAQLETDLRTYKNPQEDISTVEQAREWAAKYPDLSKTLKTLWKEDFQIMKEEFGANITNLQEANQQLARERAFNQVVRAHPDFEELVANPEFQEWVDRQPVEKGVIGKTIYDALRVNETDADAAIKAVNIFKQEQQITRTPKKNPARESAETVTRTRNTVAPSENGGRKIFKESEIEAMDRWAFDKYEDDIEVARREGRIEYDVSGAAR
jgi:chromosome segregation ATPase